jgi:hypothetical protein
LALARAGPSPLACVERTQVCIYHEPATTLVPAGANSFLARVVTSFPSDGAIRVVSSIGQRLTKAGDEAIVELCALDDCCKIVVEGVEVKLNFYFYLLEVV